MSERKIKFRVWDVLGQKMYLWPIDLTFYLDKNGTAGKYFVLQQFTGLKDKNGVEIYEGDIFQAFCEEGGELLGDIYYTLAEFRIRQEPKCIASLSYWGKHGMIIGNIFENPELLSQ